MNELLCKLIAHDIVVLIHEMHELGITPDFCTFNHISAPKIIENYHFRCKAGGKETAFYTITRLVNRLKGVHRYNTQDS